MKKLNEIKINFLKNERGQSLMEFVFMLPLMIGLVMLVIRVNSAIQVSIVNQKYSRAQVLAIAYNSPIYPSLRWRTGDGDIFVSKGNNRMVVGVSDQIVTGDGTIPPKATTQRIVDADADVGNNDPQKEHETRGNIRVRNTVSLCTMSFSVSAGGNNISVNQIAEGMPYPQRICEEAE